MGADIDEEDDDAQNDTEGEEEMVKADLSHLHAMDERRESKSLSLVGSIAAVGVQVLIDTGSSHDFLQPRIAEKLCLSLSAIKPFRVYVGNGEYLLCTHVSKQTELLIEDTKFYIDLHILAIHGPDVILGMEWLESLGRVTYDYPEKTMEFVQNGTMVFLKGIQKAPQKLSPQSLTALLSYSPIHKLYELVAVEPSVGEQQATTTTELPEDIPDPIRATLEQHIQVFSVPVGMPPKRQFDHKPINVRSFRYPYY